MKLRLNMILSAVVLSLAVSPLTAASTQGSEEQNKRIRESAAVLSEILHAGDQAIPQDLLAKAQCVGVVPNLKRAGLIVGAKYGKGYMTCRVPKAPGWSAPATIRIEGGSIGLQVGAGETDVVLMVMNRKGKDDLMKDKFTIGGDASVMAGPVGRSADAQTDALLEAKMIAYSRSHGVFAGASLEGATLRADNDDNTKMYGRTVMQSELLNGQVPARPSANAFFAELNNIPKK